MTALKLDAIVSRRRSASMLTQADEELLLLEAIDMAGVGNWGAVADHLGTKTKEECKVIRAGLQCCLLKCLEA